MPSLPTLVILPMWTMLSPGSKQSHGYSYQGCKATNHTGILQILLNPASRTYTNTRREPSKTFRNQPFGTFRNLPPEPAAYTGTLRNFPEPSGICLRNLHHFTSKLSGTCLRNLPPKPTLAYAGTLWNLPEPASGTFTSICRNSPESSSGTCSYDPHRRTAELI